MVMRKPFALLLGALIVMPGAEDLSAARPGRKRDKRTAQALVPVCYAVADLVVPVDMEPGEKNCAPTTREDQLMKVLRTTVAPESWSDKGGQATMQYFSVGMGLVIQQTPAGHDEVRRLLADLRRLQDLQVAVEIRVITLTDGLKEKVEFLEATKEMQDHVRLTQVQVKQLLELGQGDRSFNVMQAPKMTVFNGQKAKICVTDEHAYMTRLQVDGATLRAGIDTVTLGSRFYVRPLVAPDRKEITLNLGVYLGNLDGPVPTMPVTTLDANQRPVENFVQLPRVTKLEVERTLKIADGETVAVCLGSRLAEVRKEGPPPVVLGKVPYLNRIIRNVGYGSEATKVYVLVTPRLVASQE